MKSGWTPITRRAVIAVAALAFAAALRGSPAEAQKAKPIMLAATYTVPVEQQCVIRLPKAPTAATERGDSPSA